MISTRKCHGTSLLLVAISFAAMLLSSTAYAGSGTVSGGDTGAAARGLVHKPPMPPGGTGMGIGSGKIPGRSLGTTRGEGSGTVSGGDTGARTLGKGKPPSGTGVSSTGGSGSTQD